MTNKRTHTISYKVFVITTITHKLFNIIAMLLELVNVCVCMYIYIFFLQGWLSLSQSRYSMGNKCVSSLQYGQDMVPSALVHDSAAQNGGTQFHIERRESEKREEPPEVEEIRAAEQGVCV
ncbi:hypothetical protein FKM82_028384 [Ascaphus truei]